MSLLGSVWCRNTLSCTGGRGYSWCWCYRWRLLLFSSSSGVGRHRSGWWCMTCFLCAGSRRKFFWIRIFIFVFVVDVIDFVVFVTAYSWACFFSTSLVGNTHLNSRTIARSVAHSTQFRQLSNEWNEKERKQCTRDLFPFPQQAESLLNTRLASPLDASENERGNSSISTLKSSRFCLGMMGLGPLDSPGHTQVHFAKTTRHWKSRQCKGSRKHCSGAYCKQ